MPARQLATSGASMANPLAFQSRYFVAKIVDI
jgi:hypothetical protein